MEPVFISTDHTLWILRTQTWQKGINMGWKELLGFVAGFLITIGFVPQVWRLFKLKSAREISLSFTISFIVGLALWLSYGISLGLPSIILWNSISLVLGFSMLYAKLKYGR
jgi:MtN3 and saliva related transmembrane protein